MLKRERRGVKELLKYQTIWPYLWFCQTLQQSESVYKSEITFINYAREDADKGLKRCWDEKLQENWNKNRKQSEKFV